MYSLGFLHTPISICTTEKPSTALLQVLPASAVVLRLRGSRDNTDHLYLLPRCTLFEELSGAGNLRK